jgi:hypothetical protein
MVAMSVFQMAAFSVVLLAEGKVAFSVGWKAV